APHASRSERRVQLRRGRCARRRIAARALSVARRARALAQQTPRELGAGFARLRGAWGSLRLSERSLTDLPASSGTARNAHPSVVTAMPSGVAATVVPFAVPRSSCLAR